MKIEKVAVIGLGYVGLPLAVALSKNYDVVGFDLSEKRVGELLKGRDSTGEIEPEVLKTSRLVITTDIDKCKNCCAYLITVPTPVGTANIPDLSYVRSACKSVAGVMGKGAIVVLESTVYPGVTEDICGEVLETESGLKRGIDFFLGYSPERINPGDKVHTLGNLTKVVAGENEEVLSALLEMYGSVGPVYAAENLKTAEAAKVIENAQRDINIAFVNELAIIFARLGIDTGSVLEAAGTKWNFLKFRPGLVGGHCISIDPYYLTYASEKAGYHPEVILAGRRINDNMGSFIGSEVAKLVVGNELPKRILMLGITFKENVPDIRNSQSASVAAELLSFGFDVDVYDPVADAGVTKEEYDIELKEPTGKYGAVVLTVAHDFFKEWGESSLAEHLVDGGVVADAKGVWRNVELPANSKIWRL